MPSDHGIVPSLLEMPTTSKQTRAQELQKETEKQLVEEASRKCIHLKQRMCVCVCRHITRHPFLDDAKLPHELRIAELDMCERF